MDKKKLKKTILSRLAQLDFETKEIKQLAAPIEPENAIGKISRMDAINNKTINDRLLRNVRKTEKLKLALSRIDEPKLDSARFAKNPFKKLGYYSCRNLLYV